MDGAGCPYGTWPYVERRSMRDRRAMPTKLFSRFSFTGRRLGGRRREEQQNIYVDRYRRGDVLLGFSVLLLNILDAVLTLVFLDTQRGQEANPVARYLLEAGTGWFLFFKSFVVALCVLFLVMHKTFRFVRPALYLLLVFYMGLFGYHIVLQVGHLVVSRGA